MEEDHTASDSVDYSISMMDNTGPSQLQEMTMDQDLTFSNTLGRSPNGGTRGLTVKEFEEQLSNLKKENFNLKLRIYFLEEKMGTNFTLDKDNIVRKNIEYQVQITNLQKEVKEKYDLLCQAVKALDIEEDEHRKYSANKEEQMSQLQQELEDLRMQLQDIRYMSCVESPKSGCSSSRQSENVQFIHEYAEFDNKNRRFLDDGSTNTEKHGQLAHLIYDNSDSLRQKIDVLQKECETKKETVENLTRELSSANERLLDFAQQVTDYEEKLSEQHHKNASLMNKLQEEQKNKDKLKAQLAAVNQKYSMAKFDFDQEREEILREKKSLERANMILDMRAGQLSNETRKQKEMLKEMQGKLDVAMNEAKKQQTLAVSSELNVKPRASNTDDRFISVPDPATFNGAAQKDALHVQIGGDAAKVAQARSKEEKLIKSPSKSQVPSTPDGRNLQTFEQLLHAQNGGDTVAIRAEFATLKQDFDAQSKKILKLKSEQLKACEIIKNMITYRNKANEEILQLKKAKESLEKELENVVSKPQKETASVPLQTRVSEMNITAVGTPPNNHLEKSNMADDEKVQRQDGADGGGNSDVINNDDDADTLEQYKRFAVELEAKIEVLVETLNEKDLQMQYVTSQYDAILEEKENKIIDLEFELLSTNQMANRSLTKRDDFESEKRGSFYRRLLEEKEQEIEKLNGELKKCTCYLQEIVNKELWEKNREIEKMHKKQENVPETLLKLKKELSGKDLQLKLLKEKIDELGLDIKLSIDDSLESTSPKRNTQHIKLLQDQLKSVKDEKQYFESRLNEHSTSEQIIAELKTEKAELLNELKKSERLRQETNDVCSILSGRLEELAVFLDSLLKEKSILGFLGSAKNKKLREIINNSLDISRSFSLSMVGNPEQSLAQLSNITALLNGTNFQDLSINTEDIERETHLSILPDNISLTYESHLLKKPNEQQVIAALREQVFTLKSELQVRDNELNRLQRCNEDKESGIERLMSESEQEDEKKSLVTPKTTSATVKVRSSEVLSESEAWSEPDRTVSRARIGLNRSTPISTNRMSHCESTEDDDAFDSLTPSKRRSALVELNQEVYRLQHELDLKCEEIIANNVMYAQKLQEAELEKDSALKRVENLEKIVEEFEEVKKMFENKMAVKDKEMLDAINGLEKEKQIYCEQVAEAKNQLVIAQEKVKVLEDQSDKMVKQLRKEYEDSLIAKLTDAEEAFVKQLKDVEVKCEAEVGIAQENLRLIQEEYARDYLKKSDVEQKLKEAENIIKELAEVKSVIQSYEKTIASYKEQEKNIQNTMQQNREHVAALQAELDLCKERCCQLLEEKTKYFEENQILVSDIAKVTQKEHELRLQLNEIQNNVTQVTEKYHDQVATLQKQKSNLELKISELENSNADLHNRLIKAQTSRFSLGLNATLPARPSYRRLDSEENGNEARAFDRLQPAERADRNSSPDLGIESDHGRFSSLETNGNTIARPLLQTIELTESMNNLFDSQNVENDPKNASATEHCCQKSIDTAQENNELKRKLLRMKRALEETATQLNLANQRKKQVEKTICKQIHKTSQVLRKAKANLDSGSESDVFRM